MSSKQAVIDYEPINDVTVVGRLGGDSTQRDLPSGDVVVTCRIIVPRPDGRVDTLDCAIWTAALRKRVMAWQQGDVVELHGSLHRRFWRGAAGPASRYEITVTSAKRLLKAG